MQSETTRCPRSNDVHGEDDAREIGCEGRRNKEMKEEAHGRSNGRGTLHHVRPMRQSAAWSNISGNPWYRWIYLVLVLPSGGKMCRREKAFEQNQDGRDWDTGRRLPSVGTRSIFGVSALVPRAFVLRNRCFLNSCTWDFSLKFFRYMLWYTKITKTHLKKKNIFAVFGCFNTHIPP